MKTEAWSESMKALIGDGFGCFQTKQRHEKPGLYPLLTIVWGSRGGVS